MCPLRGLGGLLIWTLSACAGEGPTAADLPRVISVSVNEDAGTLLAGLSVELERAAAIQVDYWTAASPRLRVTSPGALSHEVILLRLLPDAVYGYEVRSVGAGGQPGEPHRGEFVTDTLPSDLAQIQLAARGRTSLALTMLEIIGDFRGFVAVDEDGSVIWYWRTTGIATGWTRRHNQNFVFLDGETGLVEVTPDGEVVSQLASTPDRFIHHDVEVTADNTLIFLANEKRLIDDTLWAGEAIWEWNPELGIETQRWSSFDFLSPAVDRGPRSQPSDWLHANSLSFGPQQNILISSPFLNQLISIAPDYQSLEWRLGPGAAVEAEFWGQHDAEELSAGRVLLFDNGFPRPDGTEYSRALELELDIEAQTAFKVWEFRPRPDNYAIGVSSARRLANGNTLVAFGVSGELGFGSSGIEVYEVTQGGRVEWHLQINGPLALYRATPLTSIGGETIVADP